MHNIYPAMKAVIVHDGKFLAVRQAVGEKTYWDIPGGKVDYGEDPHDTLLREVKEEVGIEIKILWPLGVWYFIRDKDKAQVVCTTFLCKAKDKKVKIGGSPAGENIKEYRWVTKEEFLSKEYNVGHESLKELISLVRTL